MDAVVPGTGPWSWILTWPADPFAVAMVLGMGFVYAGGLRRLRRAGTPFPTRWALAFWCGLGALALALVSPVDAYADVSFSVHMAQHLLLTFVAPPLLALGAPITLALRACSPARARSITGVLRGPVGRVLSHPLVGFTLFVGVPFAIHLSPLFDAALREPWVHRAEHAAWMSAALIYWWPIVGRDPTPHPVSYPVRLLSLFVAMPLMSFLALTIFVAGDPLYPAYAALPASVGNTGPRRATLGRGPDVARRQPRAGARDPAGGGRLETRRGRGTATSRSTARRGRRNDLDDVE